MIAQAKHTDISSLTQPEPAYVSQKSIPIKRILQLRDLAIQMRLHIPSIIRYLGGEYMGAHLPRKKLLALVKPLAPSKLYQNIERAFYQEIPAKLKGNTSATNFLDYKTYGNHTTIRNNIDKTMALLNKEEKNRFILDLPTWLTRFIPHLHLTQ